MHSVPASACRTPYWAWKAWRRHQAPKILSRLQSSRIPCSEGQLSPQEALYAALEENGLQQGSVRLAEDDEETWEDILEESDDPWMRSPAPLEDTLASAALLLPPSEADGRDAAVENAYETAASASLTWQEFQLLRVGQLGSDAASGWGVLDVRKQPDDVPRAPPGSIAIPLEQLSREAVEGLGCARLAVLVTADLRGRQACVRLRSVYGYRDTVLITDWQDEGVGQT